MSWWGPYDRDGPHLSHGLTCQPFNKCREDA